MLRTKGTFFASYAAMQEPREDVDSFVLRLSKQARHCGYGQPKIEFAVKGPLLENIYSLGLRTKLFEEPNYSLLRLAIDKARAQETVRRQASSIRDLTIR